VISRFILLLLVGAALLVTASFLHIISMVYLAGIVSGLCLGMVMWFRFGPQKRVKIELKHEAAGMMFEGDLANGLFLAARHLTDRERLNLAYRIRAYSDRDVMGS
jgi:hypothetical protein